MPFKFLSVVCFAYSSVSLTFIRCICLALNFTFFNNLFFLFIINQKLN